MVAHHGFELGSGVGLVFQPELGLGGASLLWGAIVAGEVLLNQVDGRSGGRFRSAAAGLALAGVLVHYMLWPWELRRGLPRLQAAEGLRSEQLRTYDAILLGWGAAAAMAVLFDGEPGQRRWAVAGLAATPLLIGSARHHFRWVSRKAVETPAWWNRALQRAATEGLSW